MRRSVNVAGLEHGTNPIPAASRVGPLLATGAVRGVDRATGALPEDPVREIELAFDNLAAVLAAGGAEPGHVAHVNVFLADKSLRGGVNEAWVRMFPESASQPARHVSHHELPAGMRLQLEALAYVTDAPDTNGVPDAQSRPVTEEPTP